MSMRVPGPLAGRLLATAMSAVLVAGVAGCGDDDDGPSRAQDGNRSGGPTPGATDGKEKGGGANTDTDRAEPTGSGAPEPQGRSGSGSDAGSADRQGGASARRDAAPQRDGEEARVAAAVGGMYRSFASADVAGVCSAMSSRARDEIGQGSPSSGGGSASGSCEQTLAGFFDVAARNGLLERATEIEVEAVTVDGPRAQATISFGGASGQVQLVQEAGRWRFTAAPVGAQQAPGG